MTKNYNSSKSNTSNIDDNLDEKRDATADAGGNRLYLWWRRWRSSRDAVDYISTRSNKGIQGGGGKGVMNSTKSIRAVSLAKTVVMTAVLLTAAGAVFDLYQTYKDAINLDPEDHVTDAEFALNEGNTEINGNISFDIPEMGMFKKKIQAQVHVTILESNPTTDGDYSFEYTLGSGEQTYEFSLTNFDPVTEEKIRTGEPLDLEYTTSITLIYLGVELTPTTIEIPAKTDTIETA
ncbi:MAG: hypothetical protein QF366_01265 [Candidatus Poseidoniia archaeon]|jgi:hypothetical protein|nr:hypothetical protein [Candidatus Poseidoniia archaeon]